jgi:hypothetical protein
VCEHDRAFGLDRLAEHDAVGAGEEPRKPVAPLLERALAHVRSMVSALSHPTRHFGARRNKGLVCEIKLGGEGRARSFRD